MDENHVNSTWDGGKQSLSRRVVFALISLAISTALWIPNLHLFFKPDITGYYTPSGTPKIVRELANQHLKLWNDPEMREKEISRMRGSNAEWDFMGRTFLVLALANLSLRDQAGKQNYLTIMDRIIEETLRLEKENSFYFFLMDYSKNGKFLASPSRSIFVDGEIALMIGARRLVEEKEEFKPLFRERIEAMRFQMNQSTVLCAESYPNECWMFCNSIALASMKISDVLDGERNSEFIQKWMTAMKTSLIEKSTGMVVSSFQMNGLHGDGPEGSTIWLAAHCLKIIDEEFAKDQYQRGRRELLKSFFGFGYAVEWPKSCPGGADVDSGPIIPFLELSAGSTGLAFLGATSFDDMEVLGNLIKSLELGGFPIRKENRLRYAGSNQVGDAVLLYALTNGPLWVEVKRRSQK